MSTNIEWTDETWNAVRGCSRTSPGCLNCYAERQAIRHSGPGLPYEGLVQITNGHPQWTGKIRTVEDKLDEPLTWRKPRMVFVNSMSDLFHEDVPDLFILKVLAVMAGTPRHTYQVLTKRPERMAKFFQQFKSAKEAEQLIAFGCKDGGDIPEGWDIDEDFECYVANSISGALGDHGVGWPMKNLWLGVSVESQKYADERIPELLRTPAAVRWISAEPLLEEIDLERYLSEIVDTCQFCPGDLGDKPVTCNACLQLFCSKECERYHRQPDIAPNCPGKPEAFLGLNWVVCGGESGPGARPFNLEWAEKLWSQCEAAKVPFFLKQLGTVPMETEERWRGRVSTRLLRASNRARVPEGFVPLFLRDRKGGDPAEWPNHLRVREFPKSVTAA